MGPFAPRNPPPLPPAAPSSSSPNSTLARTASSSFSPVTMRVATLSAVCAALVTAAAAYDYHKQPSNLVLNCKAREDRKFPDDNRRDRCLTWDEAICIQRAWD